MSDQTATPSGRTAATGPVSSRGLGLGLVREHLRRGWRVIATVRDDGGQEALRELASQGGGALEVEHAQLLAHLEVLPGGEGQVGLVHLAVGV